MPILPDEPPTRFELWLVRETGVSVLKQRAMSTDEWFKQFGGLANEYDAPYPEINPNRELAEQARLYVDRLAEGGYRTRGNQVRTLFVRALRQHGLNDVEIYQICEDVNRAADRLDK